jgi:hypothetical protein
MRRHHAIVAAAALTWVTGCFEGGSNQNQRAPGNQDDGVGISFGDIAVHPSGLYFLSKAEDELLLGTFESGETRTISGIHNPDRLAFAHGKSTVYVTTVHRERVNIAAVELRTDTKLWEQPVEQPGRSATAAIGPRLSLKVTADDRYVLIVQSDRIDVLDAADGVTRKTFLYRRPIVDVDLFGPDSRLLVTLAHEWDGDHVSTPVSFVDLDSDSQHTIDVPNCSDEVAITPSGRFAFLAPTTCTRDPVSVIDLTRERWIRNLPGFGPVAVAPDGEIAIAFLDRTNIDVHLFDDPDQIPSEGDVRYHVMFIDTRTLEFETLAIGNTLPRYALTPTGNLLLVDSNSWYEEGKLRLVRVASKEVHSVSGPDVRLDQFVITSDSLHLFLLDDGLYDLSLEAARAERVALPFVPTNINITPDDQHLLLRANPTTMWVFRISDMTLAHSMRTSSR